MKKNKKLSDQVKIISDPAKVQKISDKLRKDGKIIGVVPTMGYLHDGHLSLIKIARKKCDFVILTIFVNPTQFAPNEDFKKYPRDIKKDTELAVSAGVDMIFYPDTKMMYPDGYETYIINERSSKILEGEFRPTHFKGVLTIVAKLFNITKPHYAIFGQKDAQQAIIIKRMVKDLNFDIKIITAPIVREKDGLALSSRNIYLNTAERKDSLILVESLKLAEKMIGEGVLNCDFIIEQMRELILSKESTKIDYIKFVEPATLTEINHLSDFNNVLVLLAVKVGNTRLIDNKLINLKN